MKKLRISQIFSKLAANKLLGTNSVHLHNFISKFVKILDIFKEFAGNRVNVHDIHYLKDIQWEYHDCKILGDKGYLNAKVQQNLFDVANITLEVPYRLNQKNW